MRLQASMFGVLLCAMAAAACGEDSSNGSGGVGGTAGTGGTGGSVETATVIGVVYFYEEGFAPAQGATVEVHGTDLSTTTDANGSFTLEGVPHGDRFFITTLAGSWSVVDYWVVPEETQSGADLLVVRDAEVAAWEAAIGRAISDNHAMVDILFLAGAQGGETGDIDVDSDPPFTFSGWDAVNQQSVIADGEGFGELVFPNLDPPSGTVDATVMPAACYVDEAGGLRYPIFPKTVTLIYAICE